MCQGLQKHSPAMLAALPLRSQAHHRKLHSPRADGNVLLLLCQGVGAQLSHNLHGPCGTLPCKLEGLRDINDDLLLSGLGLAVGGVQQGKWHNDSIVSGPVQAQTSLEERVTCMNCSACCCVLC